ncbi:hypothetical protein FSP39_011945 [Pinctada imbricata]|uniref:Ribosome assembly protein 1 n=1 Tax=Pinctada imbricata TaxID=66713 RepID=A0AA88Y3F2_PINIB|nr:hypothetical protein FSP39_011945 [Pinctada imbricata]
MKGATPEMVSLLQRRPKNIRNICILAHVDHGKTTLADALVASNGIISQRMAGKLRYLDSREDEQVRGITMKSSAISLLFHSNNEEYLINLIDSPGHVDFSSEVSTAVRLCEGAIVVVDVVEGVCPQTHAVLRQAYLENITPILVLNKIDRLITELKMEPLEAYFHLQQTLEQVNLVTSELFTSGAMEKTSAQTESSDDVIDNSDPQSHDWTNIDDDLEKRNIYFTPDQGNVVFASAYDGWGFTINHFADLYSKKLGINKNVLQKTLWGDFFLNTKTKRIMKGAQSKGKKPLFVQFVLENIWSVYDKVCNLRDKEMVQKIIASLGLSVAPRDLRHNDPRVQLQAICSQWLPVSSAVLSVVAEKLPSPLELTEDRVEKLMCSQNQRFDSLPPQTQELKHSFLKCSSTEESPVIIFVSKMFPVDKKMLPCNRQRLLTDAEIQERRRKVKERLAQRQAAAQTGEKTEENKTEGEGTVISQVKEEGKDAVENGDEDDHTFIAFGRVFSGTVRKGQKVYVLGPKHNPSQATERDLDENTTVATLNSDCHVTVVTISDLYLFMGRELEYMDAVPAGNLLGIGGLEDHVLKSATLSSTLACTPFCDLYFDAAPIVRVALEPKHAGDMQKLSDGLKLLNQADPCVQVMVQETGEHVIVTAGEVHLQRCVDDLKQRYAKIDLNVSDPIVPFREMIIPPPKVDMVNEALHEQNITTKSMCLKDFEDDKEVLDAGLIETLTLNRRCCLRIRALPLPEPVTCLLEQSQELLRTIDQISNTKSTDVSDERNYQISQETLQNLQELKAKLDSEFTSAGKIWRNSVHQIWSFGPRRIGPNLLLNRVESYNRPNVWHFLEKDFSECSKVRQYDNSIVSGFQIATLAGPICEEPMRGMCYIVEKWDYIRSSESISYDTDVVKTDDPPSGKDKDMSENSSRLHNIQNGVHHVQLEDKTENGGVHFEESKDAVPSSESEDECTDTNSTEVVESMKSKRPKKKHEAPMSGQLIYCMKEGCRKAFQTQPQRLAAAMYKCSIQATSEVLGKLCAVLGQRHGQIMEDNMREGSQMFNIVAVIPVIESFGFAESIRKKTSGLASPQLVFSHWEVVDIDPYWTPTTEEELTHFGEKADSANRAREYMNKVRKRKGLKVDEKIVEHAEKQRTLTKMK